MEAAAVGSTTSATAGASVSASSSPTNTVNDLGQDAFLQLLLTQLQYQDPLNPMEDTQFIAQLAQFTSLSELQQLNATMTSSLLTSASSMIGLTVTGTDDKGNVLNGVVEAAILSDDTVYVCTSAGNIPVANITEAYRAASSV